jgi:nitrite reductase (cytochrome c-552)
MRDGSVKVSDHWLRSPLTNLDSSCGSCHKQTEEELRERVAIIQDTTAGLLRRSEEALVAAIDAIVAAKAAGATDEQLAEVYQLHRSASLRWDFISSENSTGFHSPQEAARVLAEAIDMARQAELKAVQILSELGQPQARAGE